MKIRLVTPNKYHSENFKDWLCSPYPDWYKKLRSPSPDDTTVILESVRTCPAFIDLFKNSFLVRAPQDLFFSFDEDGVCEWNSADTFKGAVPSNLPFVSPVPFNSVYSFSFKDQMGDSWDDFHSLKINFEVQLIPDRKMTCVYLDPLYHLDERSPFVAMTGTFPIYPKLYVGLNVNLFIAKKVVIPNQVIPILEGTPLCYLYFPDGKPSVESEFCSMDDWTHKYRYRHVKLHADWLHKARKIFKRS